MNINELKVGDKVSISLGLYAWIRKDGLVFSTLTNTHKIGYISSDYVLTKYFNNYDILLRSESINLFK